MISKKARDAYWKIIDDCLVLMHKVPRLRSQQRVGSLRRRMKALEDKDGNDLFYHLEPFDVACDLAEHVVDYSEWRDVYEKIMQRHQHWGVPRVRRRKATPPSTAKTEHRPARAKHAG